MGMFDGINTDGVQPMGARDPIPVGEYTMAIVQSEQKPTKDFTGKYLNLEIQVLDGKYKGARVFSLLNLWNRSQEAVDIAKRELASIKLATNTPNPTDPSQFHNKPFIGKVGISPAKDGYDAKNKMLGYKPIGAGAPAQPVQQAAPVTNQVGSKPWETVQASPRVGDAPASEPQPEIF